MESREKFADAERLKTNLETGIRALRSKLRTTAAEFELAKQGLQKEISESLPTIGLIFTPVPQPERSEKELDLLEKIAMQRSTVAQLRDELERLRVEVPKRKTLQAIQRKRRDSMTSIGEAMQVVSDSINVQAREVEQEMTQRLNESRARNEEMIRKEVQRLDEALEELGRAKKTAEDAFMGEFRKWGQLRSEIADSTGSICGKVAQKSRASPDFPMSDRIAPSLLPPIHNT
jgi:DNA repair exonuclease SbcCD ATPase subunit